MKAKPLWEWSAMGKHPVAMDYFRLGNSEPLVNAFAAWIENGYQKVVSRNRERSTFHSWRFWARGVQKGHIACAVGRDSSDGAGRPYPLLIMGTGKLPGWEEKWDLLALFFEETWTRIEQVASRRFTDLAELETDISRIKPPVEEWSALVGQRPNTGRSDHVPEGETYSRIFHEVPQAAESLVAHRELCVSIDAGHDGDVASPAAYWNYALKSHANIVPNAVFLGGVPERSYLAVFTRSLNASDFARLWSAPSEGQMRI